MAVELDGVIVRFGGVAALDGVDMSVEEGEVVCVLGPSGCGKSTLLRVIAGLELPTAGRVLLDGHDATGVPTHRRGVGLMFQDYALFPHRDVAANVAFGLRMAGGLGRAAIEARVADVLQQVGLHGFERRAVHTLSGGEQQRVALARALAPAPRVLMLDEPLGSLDRALRDRLVPELAALFSDLGVTALYVTHDQAEAFALGTRVVLLRAGQVVQAGRPEEVWRRPVDETAARFLGFANVIDGVADGEGGVRTVWGRLAAPAGAAPGPVRVVLRPDALAIGDGPVTGVVQARTFRGDHFLVSVATDAGPILEVELRGDAVPPSGARLALGIDPGGVVVLPC